MAEGAQKNDELRCPKLSYLLRWSALQILDDETTDHTYLLLRYQQLALKGNITANIMSCSDYIRNTTYYYSVTREFGRDFIIASINPHINTHNMHKIVVWKYELSLQSKHTKMSAPSPDKLQ